MNPFSRKPPSPMGPASATPGSNHRESHQGPEYLDGHQGHDRVESTSSLSNHALVSPGSIATPPPATENSVGGISAIEEAKLNAKRIVNEKIMCDRELKGASAGSEMAGPKTPLSKVLEHDAVPAANVEKPTCRVPAAPPSELKYGDRLRLWAR